MSQLNYYGRLIRLAFKAVLWIALFTVLLTLVDIYLWQPVTP